MKTLQRHDSNLAKSLKCSISMVALLSLAPMSHAVAQTAPAPADEQVVVVTGFRASLQTAMSAKKKENDMIDVIKGEDIGKFPDLNLAESLQRIPGVSIDRDGGEGRSITVRGLNSEFSRTRLNGLEALATTGGKDSSGGTNRGRGFDFNVFAADLFNSLTVRKSMSAETEEGSLGATVDLQTARPFDYKGFTMAASGQLGYNDLSENAGARGTFLISNRWADGKLGALLSVAYGERTVVEESNNTTRWENAYSAGNSGRFQSYSTDGGTTFLPIAACTTATTFVCNTTEVNATNPTLTGEAQKISRALHPRIPRYNTFSTDQKRFGMTAAFQMRPNPDTLVSLDTLYAVYGANREEHEIEAISFSRNTAGMPATDIYNYNINSEGTITKASFNDVDIRSEHRYDELTTTFKQINLSWDQNWSDKLTSKFLVGASSSIQDNPEQTTFTFEAFDVDGYSYDYTDMKNPKFNYGTSGTGCNSSQACYWKYAVASSATAATTITTPVGTPAGDASLVRLRPQFVQNDFSTVKFDAKYDLSDNFSFKGGIAKKRFEYTSRELGRVTTLPQTRNEAIFTSAMATEINTNLAKYSTLKTLAGVSYLVPNLDLIRSTFGYDCNCTNAWGTFTVNATNSSSRANNRTASEEDTSAFLQMDFKGTLAGITFRGNIGDREVETALTTFGYLGLSTNSLPTTVTRTYKDSLPSVNLVIEPMDKVVMRFAAAKTMARPTLASLSPGGSITTSSSTISVGNPYLDPTRADTMDFSLEWYPDRDTSITLALFKKDIRSYIQTQVTTKKLSELGLNYADYGLPGDTDFAVTAPINTPGGELKGYEISLQKPFTFLPGFLKHTGGLVNFTHVESQINYVTASTAATPTTPATVTYRKANLLGLSPNAYNVTLYYEDDVFSARLSAAYRDDYIAAILPGSTADFWGKHETLTFDSQATWKINKKWTLILEGLNLTDEQDDRYIAYNTVLGNTAQDLNYDVASSGRQVYVGFRYKY